MKRVLVVVAALAAVGTLVPFFVLFSQETPKKPAFAEDRVPPAVPAKAIPFDGPRAMGYLKDICELGPRQSGSPAMKRQQKLIREHFEALDAKVTAQNFSAKQSSQRGAVDMTNLVVSFFPNRTRRLILCSHYDTRPIADQEPDPRKWREPFISANDGGSGVAFLMEMGRHVAELEPQVGVDFVFFDGEEYIFERDRDLYFFGSRHFAQNWRRTKDRPEYLGAVLLDMIAGKDATFPLEGHSWAIEPNLCRDIWAIADEQRCNAFVAQVDQSVLDDHLSLQKAGIPAIDIIDFHYKHWHRLTDRPENCSAEPMQQVAQVLGVWMQRAK